MEKYWEKFGAKSKEEWSDYCEYTKAAEAANYRILRRLHPDENPQDWLADGRLWAGILPFTSWHRQIMNGYK